MIYVDKDNPQVYYIQFRYENGSLVDLEFNKIYGIIIKIDKNSKGLLNQKSSYGIFNLAVVGSNHSDGIGFFLIIF